MSNTTNAKPAKPPKKSKYLYAFKPEPDVRKALERAEEKGMVIAGIINRALRPHLKSLGFSRKNDPLPVKWD